MAAARRGFSVFPLKPGTKVPQFAKWQENATADTTQIHRWWDNRPYNIGIATGRPVLGTSGDLVVLDLDDPTRHGRYRPNSGARHGLDTLRLLAVNRADPTRTFWVDTPGGVHLYLRLDCGRVLSNSTSKLGPSIDLRGRGGYVVAAGSLLPTGEYRGPVGTEELLLLPEWIYDRLKPSPPIRRENAHRKPIRRPSAYLQAVISGEVTALLNARPGARRITLLKSARAMARRSEISDQTIWDALDEAVSLINQRDREPLTGDETFAAIRDGIKYGRRALAPIVRRNQSRQPRT
ncbi:bifunctional DNA primase/polymerase [Crossiella sp. SN42]|uniref:bifunctional DNA primase/polymerase n=1 Tax=Crossiella sp. SN42 TaxID=2944808 RepID=UPI00207C57D3|nr:bifunctional DNA primase/polymerase [Crossiella sp. SN42]MCO1575604.1 bifunctional DNA primase/polymerase [Crossiella sp. SN42]